jgi:hypothetical protein
MRYIDAVEYRIAILKASKSEAKNVENQYN